MWRVTELGPVGEKLVRLEVGTRTVIRGAFVIDGAGGALGATLTAYRRYLWSSGGGDDRLVPSRVWS